MPEKKSKLIVNNPKHGDIVGYGEGFVITKYDPPIVEEPSCLYPQDAPCPRCGAIMTFIKNGVTPCPKCNVPVQSTVTEVALKMERALRLAADIIETLADNQCYGDCDAYPQKIIDTIVEKCACKGTRACIAAKSGRALVEHIREEMRIKP